MRRLIQVAILVVLTVVLSVQPVMANVSLDRRTNRFRRTQGLHRLVTRFHLTDVARMRARQIARPGGFFHDFSWIDTTHCSVAGENIAYRIPAPDNPPRWFFRAWRNSPEHRHNMLGRWAYQGSAIYFANGGAYGVQVFCKVN